MNGILNRIFVFIGLPAMSVGISQTGRGGDNEVSVFPLFEPLKPIRFLLPVKKDYRLEREESLTNGTGRSHILHARGALGK